MDDRHAWEQPGTHEVGAGVYRIPLPLPGDHLHAVNVYAIADSDRVVLIDGGWALADAQQLLASALDAIGYGLGDVREFLVTHLHRDHYTQAIAVRREYGTPVSVGEGEQPTLRILQALIDGTATGGHPSVTQLRSAGAPELADIIAAFSGGDRVDLVNWEDPDRWLTDGIDIELTTRTLRVIHTPGHTRDHVVFHDQSANALFAGDHVLPHITPSIGFELARAESPLSDYLASLRLMRALPDSRLLPAHGPITSSTHHRVDELLDHHEQRLTETAEAVARGASTGFDVAQSLTWTRKRRSFADLDVFNQMMAVHESMAHLEVLVERGWLSRVVEDEVVHFTRR